MKPDEALRVVRAAMQTYKALEFMEDALKVAEVAARDNARLTRDIRDLETRARDLGVQVDNEERQLAGERNRIEAELEGLRAAAKTAKDRLTSERNKMQREHDASVKAIKTNEERLKAEFEQAAQERRRTLAGLERQIAAAEAAKAALKAQLG